LYKEHYTSIPTKNEIDTTGITKKIQYSWEIKKKWNRISVSASKEKEPILAGSVEEFIFEHYYGYTKINSIDTQEYKVNHPRWLINKVLDYSIQCDFASMYGNDFSFLNNHTPESVIVAEGSPVTINWKRTDL
jgi:hypothetical protein